MRSRPVDSARIIHTIRAKHQGEVRAHTITRCAFLRCVVFDDRKCDLFESWGQTTGLDTAVELMSVFLDRIAARAGVPHRSSLRGQTAAIQRVVTRTEWEHLVRLGQHIDRRLAETLESRTTEMLRFVDVLCNRPGRFIWLADDLMTLFEVELRDHIWGTKTRVGVPDSATLRNVPRGRRPNGQGEHLQRNARWYYRARVAARPATVADLAREYTEASSIPLVPKDDAAGIVDRPDTKTVRDGIAEAERLLTRALPPQQWPEIFKIHA
jgi:hypothetical protein